MEIKIAPGAYVVAVSGGVDSMTLLNMLSKMPKLKLTVAHYDHGIRSDSDKDRQLVQSVAKQYGLPFVFDEGRLGPKASEAVARQARYKFLKQIAKSSGAKAIITAHHQDDLLETAIINMLRGTGRRGLSSLKDQPDLLRPLLKFNKSQITDYAKAHNLKWREDSTNQDTSYLRNYVRHKIIPIFSAAQKTDLLKHVDKLGQLNNEIDSIIGGLVSSQSALDRQWFISLDHNVARDILAGWLRDRDITEIDSRRLELLVRAAKTYKSGKKIDIDKNHILEVETTKLALHVLER